VSSDGSVVVGIDHATSGNNRAFRWTAATGMQTLGVLSGGSASSANAVNADGSVVAGFSYTSGFNQGRATRWTAAGGLQNLGVVSGATASNAFGVSADGSVVVGISGDFGFRWTAGAGMQSIGLLPTADFAEAIAVSPNGSAITGDSGGLAFTNDGFDAIRWTSAGGIQDLGVLAGGDTARGYSLSADTSIVVGDSNSSNGLRGFLWTPSLGMVDLNAYLPSVGIDLTGWTLTSARGISADGSAIAGYGTFNGADRAFLVSGLSIAPEPGSALLLVCGALAGTRGRRRRRVVT
jgi:probable HAF family extracellular repeat protein